MIKYLQPNNKPFSGISVSGKDKDCILKSLSNNDSKKSRKCFDGNLKKLMEKNKMQKVYALRFKIFPGSKGSRLWWVIFNNSENYQYLRYIERRYNER